MEVERLRLMNQDLLQKLKANQEAFKKRLHAKLFPPSSPSKQATPQTTQGSDNQHLGEIRQLFSRDSAESVMTVSAETGPWATKRHPHSPLKSIMSRDEKLCQGPCHPASRGTETIHTPFVPVEDNKHPTYLHSIPETDQNGGRKASVRMPQAPKSILLTPQAKESRERLKKESGHVTFVSDPEEHTFPADSWSVRPFLGYDWIAGLLDMDSSMSEKPEEFFSELQDFRRVNREACIYDRDSRLEGLGSSIRDRESELDISSHECVFCYRLNKRLFAAPLDPESACPVCKTPRACRPPETLVEPAFVRVSIPRSTLLPPYKHRIHRRKSFEPADNLALPSHCLAGWENPVQTFSPTLSSLDLRSSLDEMPSGRKDRSSVSRVTGGSKTDELLDLSRVVGFELGNLSWRSRRHKLPCYKTTSD